MRRTHEHRCDNQKQGCKGIIRCSAPAIDNYDGWPEVYCSMEEHGPIICEECHDAELCEECGIPEHLTHAIGCPKHVAKAS
jgi:hypothetical protein